MLVLIDAKRCMILYLEPASARAFLNSFVVRWDLLRCGSVRATRNEFVG